MTHLIVDCEKFTRCRACGDEIAVIVGQPPEKFCADCGTSCTNCLKVISLRETVWIGGDPFVLSPVDVVDTEQHPYCAECAAKASESR